MWNTYDANGLPLQSIPLGYALMSRTLILTGTTSYTVPSGTRAIFVECIGAGGGGGGVLDAATNSAGAGGGGGGGYSNKWILGPKLTAFTVAVGAKGAGGASGANNGVAGGDTTFDSPAVVTGKGGLGGISDTVSTLGVGGLGGDGGPAATGVGDIKVSGQPGGAGLRFAAAQAIGGEGGHSYYGRGANARKTQGDGVAAASTDYGGGGGGGVDLSSAASQAGGNGADGLIVVWEFA